MLSRVSILAPRLAFILREAPEVKGRTKFSRRKVKKVTEPKVDLAKDKARRLALFERFGKVIFPIRPVRPHRTPDELAEARRITVTRAKNLQIRDFQMRRRETNYIKLRTLAYEELPTESLKRAAAVIDDVEVPPDFITMLLEPPIEEQEIFGPFMTAEWGSDQRDDD